MKSQIRKGTERKKKCKNNNRNPKIIESTMKFISKKWKKSKVIIKPGNQWVRNQLQKGNLQINSTM